MIIHNFEGGFKKFYTVPFALTNIENIKPIDPYQP